MNRRSILSCQPSPLWRCRSQPAPRPDNRRDLGAQHRGLEVDRPDAQEHHADYVIDGDEEKLTGTIVTADGKTIRPASRHSRRQGSPFPKPQASTRYRNHQESTR